MVLVFEGTSVSGFQINLRESSSSPKSHCLIQETLSSFVNDPNSLSQQTKQKDSGSLPNK